MIQTKTLIYLLHRKSYSYIYNNLQAIVNLSKYDLLPIIYI